VKGSPRGVFRSAEICQYSSELEALDLAFAVADEPQRHRLHPAGRACAGQLAPQHRRQGEADKIIERAARQIGVDQRRVDLARIGHRVETAFLVMALKTTRDRLVLERLLLVEHFQHMPGNRFALAVGVGRENQRVGTLECLGDVLEPLVRCRVDFSTTWRNPRRAHRSILGRQVADMAERGQHLVLRSRDIC
jgi:hypothetical protein